jgi:hypothetical protein
MDRPVTSNPQLVINSGLNWWAIQLVAESAKKAGELLDTLGSMSVDVDGIRVTVERVPGISGEG